MEDFMRRYYKASENRKKGDENLHPLPLFPLKEKEGDENEKDGRMVWGWSGIKTSRKRMSGTEGGRKRSKNGWNRQKKQEKKKKKKKKRRKEKKRLRERDRIRDKLIFSHVMTSSEKDNGKEEILSSL